MAAFGKEPDGRYLTLPMAAIGQEQNLHSNFNIQLLVTLI
jgi:hypothetical protein